MDAHVRITTRNMLPYDTSAYLYSTESVLKYLQDFTAHPMAMLIPDIKAANPLFQFRRLSMRIC